MTEVSTEALNRTIKTTGALILLMQFLSVIVVSGDGGNRYVVELAVFALGIGAGLYLCPPFRCGFGEDRCVR